MRSSRCTLAAVPVIVRALGCPGSVLLDGGSPGRMLVRSAKGHVRVWPGLGRVPLALVALLR